MEQNATVSSSKSLFINCPLTRENYQLWRFKMLPLLDDEKLATISTNTEGIKTVIIEDSSRAKRAITMNLSDTIAVEVMQLNTAGEIWEHFEQSFSGVSHSRKLLGIQKLCSFRHQSNSIRSTVAELRTILNETITASNTKSITFEELATAMLVNSLSSNYSVVRSRIMSEKLTTLDKVQDILLKEEEIIKAAA
ncbi:hypothetical protein HDV02_004422, partial [Globomyces sp. JEL0801]